MYIRNIHVLDPQRTSTTKNVHAKEIIKIAYLRLGMLLLFSMEILVRSAGYGNITRHQGNSSLCVLLQDPCRSITLCEPTVGSLLPSTTRYAAVLAGFFVVLCSAVDGRG